MTWSLIFQKKKLSKTDCSKESEGSAIVPSQETVEQNMEEK